MATIKRRQAPREAEHPTGRFWLRFVDGQGRHLLTVDPSTCPRSIHARPHWVDNDLEGEVVYDELHGEDVILGRCRCEPTS